MGCLLQDRRRHGCRRRAYKDVFTACLEKDIPYPGEQIPSIKINIMLSWYIASWVLHTSLYKTLTKTLNSRRLTKSCVGVSCRTGIGHKKDIPRNHAYLSKAVKKSAFPKSKRRPEGRRVV